MMTRSGKLGVAAVKSLEACLLQRLFNRALISLTNYIIVIHVALLYYTLCLPCLFDLLHLVIVLMAYFMRWFSLFYCNRGLLVTSLVRMIF